MGVGPLGCAPRIAWEGAYVMDGRDCVEEVNEIVADYNAKLSVRLRRLNSELAGAEIVFCDVHGAIMEIISNPLIYGTHFWLFSAPFPMSHPLNPLKFKPLAMLLMFSCISLTSSNNSMIVILFFP